MKEDHQMIDHREIIKKAVEAYCESWRLQGVPMFYEMDCHPIFEHTFVGTCYLASISLAPQSPEHRIVIHRATAETELEAWQRMFYQMMIAGVAKEYEIIVSMIREQDNRHLAYSKEDLIKRYPLRPSDCFKKPLTEQKENGGC